MNNRLSAGGKGASQARGFTLVEMMTVLAVLSILALVAMTSYQDYVLRSQISEGIRVAAAHKSGVLSTFYSSGLMPGSNTDAGMDAPIDYNTEYVYSVGISSNPRGGTITISYNILKLGSDNLLQLVPTDNDGIIEWICRPSADNGILTNFLPSNCRGT
ncbi:MAG: pilin [Pseudomonadota bacterium]